MNCRFNLKYITINEKKKRNFLPYLIKDLGGEIVDDIDKTTHYIIGKENEHNIFLQKKKGKCLLI